MQRGYYLILGMLMLLFSSCTDINTYSIDSPNQTLLINITKTNTTLNIDIDVNMSKLPNGSTINNFYNVTNITNLTTNNITNISNFYNVTNISNNNIINANLTLLKDQSFVTNVTSINFMGSSVDIANNGNGSANITITSSGSGGGSSTYGMSVYTRVQNTDIANNLANFSADTDIDFNVYEGRAYLLYCNIMYTTAAATTGQTLQLNNSGSSSNVYVMYDTWSSATASVGLSATSFGTLLVGTGSGATIIRPNRLQAYWYQTNNATLNLSFRSEVALSQSNFLRGSQCDLYDTTNQTRVVEGYNQPPARAIQLTDLNNNLANNSLTTNMSFNVSAGYSYNLLCNIMYTTAVATTGQTLQLNNTGSTSNVYVMYDTWSSATASVGVSATSFGTLLVGTGSGATIIRPNRLQAYFEQGTDGTITLYMRSEVALSQSNFLKGSMCQLYNNTIS